MAVDTRSQLPSREEASLRRQVLHADPPETLWRTAVPVLASDGRFVRWTHAQRVAGQCVSFAVLPEGFTSPVGMFQMRSLESRFTTAEWGFALGSPFWGTGLFCAAARLVLDFAFITVGGRRLQARAGAANRRGNRGLRQLGAT